MTSTFALLLALSCQSLWAQPSPLTVDQAVKSTLANDSGIQSAVADWNAGVEQAVAAKLRMLPSLTLAGGYTKLSDLPAQSFDITLGPMTYPVTFPSSPTDSYSFSATLRYPIFMGFRLLEAAKIADLQAMSKQATLKMMREAMAFEARRAYWQAKQADAGLAVAKQSLEVTKALVDEVKAEVNQGFATLSDELSMEQREAQAQMAVSDAASMRDQAYVALATLMGRTALAGQIMNEALGADGGATALPFSLTSPPDNLPAYPHTNPIDLKALIAQAQAGRGDLQAASLGVQMAQHAQRETEAGLYPTIAAVGDYTYANPNQRVFPPTNSFTGTWDVGVQVSINLGGLPAAVAQTLAAGKQVEKAQKLQDKQLTGAVLDVRRAALVLSRSRSDLRMTQSSVTQAKESLRVARQKLENGEAKHTDVLEAELGLLRAQLAVTNREIGLQIALADLARATSMKLP